MAKTNSYKFSKEINAQLIELSKSDNYHSVLALFSDYLFIFLAILLSFYSFYFYPLSILIIGARQRAFATILHEAAHNRAASNKTLNYILGAVLSGYWIFQGYTAYRNSHVILHHGFLGDPTKDPDFQFHIKQGLYQGINRKKFIISEVFYPFILIKSWPFFIYLIKKRLFSSNYHYKELISTLIFWYLCATVLTIYNLWGFFLLFWIIPYFTTFIIINHFIELAEHYPLLAGDAIHSLQMTRNRFSHWIENFFCSIHHENYHLTHHLNPGIPFWNMPKAHALMMQDPCYQKINRNFGGIFRSANKNHPALIPALITGKLALPLQYKNKTSVSGDL